MNTSDISLDLANLRSRAEKLAANVSSAEIEAMSTWDVKNLIQELQVYQVELEMQNEQLIATTAELHKSHEKYVDLYDFAPIGYMTLDKKSGVITELNLAMTQILGIKRSLLREKSFAQFIAPQSKNDFYAFFKNTFEFNHKQMCELYLQPKNGSLIFVRLEGLDGGRSPHTLHCCRIAVIDMSTIRV